MKGAALAHRKNVDAMGLDRGSGAAEGGGMKGFAILLAFNLIGMALHRFGHVPMPENVLGMLLLLAALVAGVVKVEWVESAAGFLLHHMMLFFAPIIVGVVPLLPVIEANLAPVVGGIVVSTFLAMLATAWTAQVFFRQAGGRGGA